MITAGEHSLSLYNCVRGMGFGKILGGDEELIRQQRIALLDKAISVCDKAYSTPKFLVGEPSDDSLDAIKAYLVERRQAL